ncbi:tyrosine-type recombinase/integrase [Yoonia sp.]|uniref:tyrosine-type recombinase/integrase n=1 Tax=Yoonia sp. TaxID=2212373 RepID=UPI002600197C|nr:tyrosine-type recombinase/integrase [Yoonia sp.]
MNFIMKVKQQKITRVEAQRFLTAIVSIELERIEAERYAEPHAKTPGDWRNRYLDERARAIALRKVASMGPAAQLFEEDRSALTQEFTHDDAFERVERHIQFLTGSFDAAFTDETLDLAKAHITRSGFSDDDVRVLLQIRLTGTADAMTQSDRKNQTTPFVGLMPDLRSTEMINIPPLTSIKPSREGYDDSLDSLCQAYFSEGFKDSQDPAEQKKIAKDRRQNHAVLTQFCAAVGKKRLTDLQQQDLHFYVSVLERMPKVYGRSIKDRELSIMELLERAEELPDDEVGLSSATINRNLTILRNFLKYARGRGARPTEELFLSDLRRKDNSDERSARLAFTDSDVMKLAQHPIWTGCRSAERRNMPGNHVIKDGLYWGPIIAAASGARREEIMGLAIEDIVMDGPIPYILIQPNAVRRLKNASSHRAVPIHSRLMEHGFSDYVQELQERGEHDLFPDLRPGTPTETYGNVFYKPWKAALDMQLAEDANRKTFHSFRHRVISILRHDPEIDKASVKDLVGHRHEDVTDSVYRDPAKLLMLQRIVEAIPVVF